MTLAQELASGVGKCRTRSRAADDHDCVDGLSCRVDRAGTFHCSNTNLDDDGSTVHAFHNPGALRGAGSRSRLARHHEQVNFDHRQTRCTTS